MKSTVSIIIPVYKVEQYIYRCLNSVINQTYKKVEIILIDDGSPDNCPHICDEYAEKDSRIKVIHKMNGGLSDARNIGLKHVTGDYIFFVDSDDFIHERTVEYLVELAERYKADIVQCDRELGERDTFTSDAFNQADKVNQYNNCTIFESSQNNVIICAKLYKKSVWDEIEMPVGKLNEDDYTTWKLYYKAKEIVVSSYKLYYNYINPDGICSNLKKKPNIDYPIEAYHERIAFFDKIGNSHLSDLSKWRFIKFILLSYRNKQLSTEQKNVLRHEFNQIRCNVIKCKNVPLAEKILILIFSISPSFSNLLLQRL